MMAFKGEEETALLDDAKGILERSGVMNGRTTG